MQRERRRDPYPWTWEPAAAAAIGTLLVLSVGIQLGRGVANLLAGAGWTWPETDAGGGASSPLGTSPLGTAFWSSLPGLVTGHADAGLANPVPGDLAGPRLLWTSIALTELTLLAAAGWAIGHIYLRWGPGRMRGMATAAEAEKLLGLARLRKAGPLVRPDIYDRRHAPRPAPVHRNAGGPEEPAVEVGRGLSPWQLERPTTKETR